MPELYHYLKEKVLYIVLSLKSIRPIKLRCNFWNWKITPEIITTTVLKDQTANIYALSLRIVYLQKTLRH